MYSINAISTISHQDSFKNENLIENLVPIVDKPELVAPNYKEYISGGALRRLSTILRISLVAAYECKNQVTKDFDAIIVGTALGCLQDTEKFLNVFHTSTSEFLSPTSFIQSTHNTIGGQISLEQKNHSYNMTHTQNNLSFEVALLDAMMCINEGKENVLVGASDEKTAFLEHFQSELIRNDYPLTTCASFFVIEQPSDNGILIQDVNVNFNCSDLDEAIIQFLKKHDLSITDIDLSFHSNSKSALLPKSKKCINYLEFSGMNLSASAFALHLAHDYLKKGEGKYALVVNELCDRQVGLTLVSKK